MKTVELYAWYVLILEGGGGYMLIGQYRHYRTIAALRQTKTLASVISFVFAFLGGGGGPRKRI